MDQYALLTFLYKILITVSGLVIILLGYKLFVKGIFNESGDIKATWNDKSLLIKKAAPGTFFVLFGACIIAISTYKGIEFNGSSEKNNLKSSNTGTVPKLPDTLNLQ